MVPDSLNPWITLFQLEGCYSGNSWFVSVNILGFNPGSVLADHEIVTTDGATSDTVSEAFDSYLNNEAVFVSEFTIFPFIRRPPVAFPVIDLAWNKIAVFNGCVMDDSSYFSLQTVLAKRRSVIRLRDWTFVQTNPAGTLEVSTTWLKTCTCTLDLESRSAVLIFKVLFSIAKLPKCWSLI